MSNKKTGLGSSLLLKRTTPPNQTPNPGPEAASPAPERQERLDVPGAQQPAVEVPSRNPNTAVPRDRCTLYLDQDVNDRLETAARVERKQRSELASEILRQHLPNYRIDRI